jgi:hypothetical protein
VTIWLDAIFIKIAYGPMSAHMGNLTFQGSYSRLIQIAINTHLSVWAANANVFDQRRNEIPVEILAYVCHYCIDWLLLDLDGDEMSTRCTIWYNKNEVPRLHLYAECLDDSIWLEIDQEFSVVTIPFPKEMVKAILESETCKGFAEHGPDLSWLDNLSKKP